MVGDMHQDSGTDEATQQLMEALALHEQGRLAEAKRLYNRILEDDPESADALHLLGVANLQCGDIANAITLINAAIQLHPSAAFYTNLGTAHKTSGDSQKAIECFCRALAMDDATFEAHTNLGDSFMRREAPKIAATHFEKALLIRQESPDTYNNLGLAYAQQGILDRAHSCYIKALDQHPKFAEANNNLGALYFHQSNLSAAEKCFQKAIGIRPGFSEAHLNLADLYAKQKQIDKAIHHYDLAVHYQPDCEEGMLRLGECYLRVNNRKDAEKSFRRVLLLNPQCASAHFKLGYLKFLHGAYREAADHLEASLHYQPNNGSAYCYLGKIHAVHGAYDKALYDFQMAYELDGHDAEAYFQAARILLMQNNILPAKHLLQEAIRIAPDHYRSLAMLARIAKIECEWTEHELYNGRVILVINRLMDEEQSVPLSGQERRYLDLPKCLEQRAAEDHVLELQTSASYLTIKEYPQKTHKLRIGYYFVEADHPALDTTFRGLLQFHDRTQFEIHYYFSSPKPKHHDRLAERADYATDVFRYSSEEIASRIQRDGIHVLVVVGDLADDVHARAIAYQPAPIQIQAFNRALATPSPSLPHQLCTRNAHLEGMTPEPQPRDGFVYTKTSLYATLPFSKNLPEISRAQFDLDEQDFVIGMFIDSEELDIDTFERCLNILDRCPTAKLWINSLNEHAKNQLENFLSVFDADKTRVIFGPESNPLLDWRHQLADLLIIPHRAYRFERYLAAAYSCTPFIAMHQSESELNHAEHLLLQLDLEELCVPDADAMLSLCCVLSKTPELLEEYRARLLKNRYRSPVFQASILARELESAYQLLWDNLAAQLGFCSFSLVTEGSSCRKTKNAPRKN